MSLGFSRFSLKLYKLDIQKYICLESARQCASTGTKISFFTHEWFSTRNSISSRQILSNGTPHVRILYFLRMSDFQPEIRYILVKSFPTTPRMSIFYIFHVWVILTPNLTLSHQKLSKILRMTILYPTIILRSTWMIFESVTK